jgi:MerR family transcriptional regulator, light-induced transcriptional regulator
VNLQYSIKDLEQLSGIKAHTLRVWESRYQVLAPKRTTTNIRYYDTEDLKHVLNISVLCDHGYKISKIANMDKLQMREEVIKLTRDYTHYPDQILSLTLAMVDLDEPRFEKTIASNIRKIGLVKTMTEVIYPFFTRIGVLWHTGSINPAQEHFITHLIRQKLIVAVDSQIHSPSPNSKKFIAFLPDGELHEIGLLFATWLIKSHNHTVFYLGQSLPVKDLVEVCKVLNPDYLFGIFSGAIAPDAGLEYIKQLALALPAKKILLSGHFIQEREKALASKITHLKAVKDLQSMLDSLPKSQV